MGTLDGYRIHLYYSDRSNDWGDFLVLDYEKEDLLEEINKGRKEPVSVNWYWIGKFVYVPLALILCIIALVKGISF